MADIFYPPSLGLSSLTLRYLDSTGISRSPYTGAVRTASLGGDKLGALMNTTAYGGGSAQSVMNRAQLASFLTSLSGRRNRAIFMEPTGRVRGSMPTTELVTNGTFTNGTTGWASIAGGSSLSVQDNVMRVFRAGNSGAANGYTGSSISVGNFTPYAIREAIAKVVGGALPYTTFGNGVAIGVNVGGGAYGVQLTDAGLSTAWAVSTTAGAGLAYSDNAGAAGVQAGLSFYDVAWYSAAQCLLADAPDNLVTYSDSLANANWTPSNVTVTDNNGLAPNGQTIADTIIPTATSAAHYVSQTLNAGANGVLAQTIIVRANGYNFVRLQLNENTSSSAVYQLFNLNTGALGATSSTGTNWIDRRAFITDLGNGWFACSLVARNTNSATSYSAYIVAESVDGVAAYSGNGTSGIYAWRATVQQSALPIMPNLSTSAAISGSTYPAGSTQIGIKSAQLSVGGLLLAGDWVEIITSYGSELKMVTAALNTDSAGRGTLCFSPPIRGSVGANAIVIVARPCGRFVFAGPALEWATDPGIITAASFEFEEAVG